MCSHNASKLLSYEIVFYRPIKLYYARFWKLNWIQIVWKQFNTFLICINPGFKIPLHLYLQTCDLAALMIDCLMFSILLKKKKTFGEIFINLNIAIFFFGSLCCNKPQQDLALALGADPQPGSFCNKSTVALFQKDDVFKAVPTPLSPPPAPATPATPSTPASSVSSGTPGTPNSISPSGIVKRKTGQCACVCLTLITMMI